MTPRQASDLVGHSPQTRDIVEPLSDIIRWVEGNRACIWVEKDIADLRDALAEIQRLRTALRSVRALRASTDQKWADHWIDQTISDALRETET